MQIIIQLKNYSKMLRFYLKTSSFDASGRKLISGDIMKISYKKLWVLLLEREISKIELRENTGIATGTMTKLNKGEEVSLNILLRICEYLNCDIGDICEAVKE